MKNSLNLFSKYGTQAFRNDFRINGFLLTLLHILFQWFTFINLSFLLKDCKIPSKVIYIFTPCYIHLLHWNPCISCTVSSNFYGKHLASLHLLPGSHFSRCTDRAALIQQLPFITSQGFLFKSVWLYSLLPSFRSGFSYMQNVLL